MTGHHPSSGEEGLNVMPPNLQPQDLSPAPPYQPPVAPAVPRREKAQSNMFVILAGVMVGLFLFVGLLSFHAAFLIPYPSSNPTTEPNVIAYRDTLRALGWVSAAGMDLAVAFSVTLAWIVGGLKFEIPDSTRRGIFIFATVFLAIWIIFSFSVYSIFRFIIP